MTTLNQHIIPDIGISKCQKCNAYDHIVKMNHLPDNQVEYIVSCKRYICNGFLDEIEELI